MKTGPRIFGAVIFVVALWAQNGALAGVFYDDGIYLTLAKSLAEGQGYHYAHLPGSPAALHYPPLYPTALALIWFVWPIFPASVVLFKLFSAVCFGAAAMVLARYSERFELSAPARYTALLIGFTAYPLLSVVGVLMSEPLFLLLAGAAMAVLEDEDDRRAKWIAGGALLGLAVLTRTIGVAFLAGAVLVVWNRRGRRQALVLGAVASVMLIPWVGWLLANGDAVDPRLASNYGTYLTEATQAGPAGFLAGLDLSAAQPLARLALPRLPAFLWWPLSIGLLGVTAWGGYRSFRRVPMLVTSLAIYMGVVTLWPFIPDRFVWIVLPWLILFFARGIRDVWTMRRWGRWAAALLYVVLFAGFGRKEFVSLRHRGFEAAARGISDRFALGLTSLRAEIPPGSVVATEDEALVYLYTGRKTVPNYLFNWRGRETRRLPTDETYEFFCDNGVTHLFTTGPDTDARQTITELQQTDRLIPLFEMTDGPALFALSCR